ncbi:Wzz/FepE/Etk N-terminal domain-containing protein [Cyclobacterium roseum]|uniref:Wzz/FepE/Etk N-terminal domain-containing protein n=1 Tax=Cyclobacterium roseum TaxID=2666137 RepID=UPI0013908368|nr:Wzz/FepE/Etk N-terminal domain-containing protein [Cyclobacterium roseum]
MSKLDKKYKEKEDYEIDLIGLVKAVWISRRLIISITLIFMVIGLLVALLSQKEYTASSTFVPQTAESGKNGSSLSGLASLAGINLGGVSGGSEIPPILYPKLVSSVPFRKMLLDAEISLPGSNEKVTYKKYYTQIYSPGILGIVKEYTLGLPGKLIKVFRNDSPITDSSASDQNLMIVSKEDYDLFKRLEGQLEVKSNDKEGFTSISFIMPDPKMAAQMAKFTESLLQKEVIAYKIQNAREQLKFTESQFEEKKEEFQKIQAELSNFRDRNQNIVSASVNNELQRLEAEYNFAFNIYTELAKQLEQAKLQVSKDTPVFSIIEPVTVPAEKSAPKRPLILIVFTFVGLVVALGVVFGTSTLRGLKEEWEKV